MYIKQKDIDNEERRVTDLSALIKSNDDQVLSELYQKNYSKVLKFLLENNGNETETKDIYQEAFLIVWNNIKLNKFLPGTENEFAGYLFQVARNKWMDVLRLQKRRTITTLNETEEQHTHFPEAENKYAVLVKKNFAKLGQTCKEILTSFYFDNKSIQNIAASKHWTEATAKNNKYRCIQQLRALVKNERN